MRETNGADQQPHVYPYDFSTRKLTKGELSHIREDLVAAGRYTEKYNDIFVHPDTATDRELDLKYDDIQNTMEKIMHRGESTDHYTAFEQTPLLVADVFVYLWEIIDFMQCRTAPGSRYRVDITGFPNWSEDERELIRMEQEVRELLASIAPPELVLHAVIAHAVHKAV
jgi:hypothetical protein